MRLLLLAALLAAPAAGAFRPEAVAKFREANEEKMKQAILDAEAEMGKDNAHAAAAAATPAAAAAESGDRSDLAGQKRDPDDSIQQNALKAMRERFEAALKNGSRTQEERERDEKRGLLGGDKSSQGPFDYLMFTMIYPTATCMADDDQAPGSCEIPAGTAPWTIHGLWPNYADGSYPQFCDPAKFDAKQVQQLHEQMRTKWPNLFPRTPEAQLWSHEWEKHGTCSKSDALLDSQFKYFNMSLFMLDHIDLKTRMEQKGISPRAAPYERASLQKTLDEVIGHRVQMYCLMDKKTHESLLADVRVCVDRALKPIDCPEAEVRPFVAAGSLTPDDHQPLPVPKRCADTLYYVSAGMDLSKTIDVLPAAPVEEKKEEAKKKEEKKEEKKKDDDEEEDDDADYYVDDPAEKEEEERSRLLEQQLMEGLRLDTDKYQEHRKHVKDAVAVRVASASAEPAAATASKLKMESVRARDYGRFVEMARKYQQSRVASDFVYVDPQEAASSSRPTVLYVCIVCLSLYLMAIAIFLYDRRRSTAAPAYGRLQHA